MNMDKPIVGDKVKLVKDFIGAPGNESDTWRIFAVHDSLDVWWDTAVGENKVALQDALEDYGPEKAATAKWYAEIESIDDPSASLAVASFEVEPA